MTIALYRSDGVTPLAGASFTGLAAGQLSDVITFRAAAEGVEHRDVLLLQRVLSKTEPDTWLAEGLPPQDELWGRVRVVGQDNAADPAWTATPTDWTPWGAWSGILLPRIPADCAVILEWAQQPPSGAAAEPYTWGVVPLYSENARPMPPALTQLDRGVLSGVGDGESSMVLAGLEVTASAVPDAEVHVAPGLWLHAGDLEGDVTRDVELDQADSAAAALAAGEAYYAVLTRGAAAAGVTVTKGTKAAAPVAPARPAGETYLNTVRVDYQVGGTSVIEADDITGTPDRGRYAARVAGADLVLSPGQALAGGTWRYAGGEVTVALEDDATNCIWLLASGLPERTTTAVRPESTALLLWEADKAAGVVTALRDRRRYAGGEVVIVLKGAGDATGLVDEQLVEHEVLVLEAVTLRLSDHTGASAGETVADLEVEGASVYVDQATDDRRPRVAWDAAAPLVDRAGVHQLTTLRRGELVAFHLDELATGAAPARAELHLVCRRP